VWQRLRTLQRRNETTATLDLDFPACVERAFPASFPVAWEAVHRVLSVATTADLSPLAKHSPALRGYDWRVYLTCSVVRMTRVLEALRAQGPAVVRVLDYGAYFGNVSLMCASAGYAVDAVDGFRACDGALDGCVTLLKRAGVRVADFHDTGHQLTTSADGTYDAVVCLGVLEHIAHTPRFLLQTLDRVLRPGGTLILDTPNLAYAYTRDKLARGQTIFCPLEAQYDTEVPFEGHHREYTIAEVRWMLERLRHVPIEIETFNYSQFALGQLHGVDVQRHRQMERDPAAREIIFAVSRKPS